MINDDKFTGLFIATPAYLGNVHAAFCSSLLQTGQHLTIGRIRWRNEFFTGASAVQIARGVLVAQFMASGYSHLLFIDADLAWKPDALRRLLAASEYHDVCCGVYPKKTEPLGFPVNVKLSEDGQLIGHEKSGCLQLTDACSGFMMIRRCALEQMMAAYPGRKCSFREESQTTEAEGRYEFNLFDFFIDDDVRRMYLSEDFGFSRLYQRIGGAIWADPEIRLAHYGAKRYEGALRDVMVESEPMVAAV
jgi:hypothetical protein